MRTATQEMMRVDLRCKRAQQLAAAVLQKLGRQIDATASAIEDGGEADGGGGHV
jgi:hypothetical protein